MRLEEASRSASSSLSAQTAITLAITCGAARSSESVKRAR